MRQLRLLPATSRSGGPRGPRDPKHGPASQLSACACSYLLLPHLSVRVFASLFHHSHPPSSVSPTFNLVRKQCHHHHLLLCRQPTSFLQFEPLLQPLQLALPILSRSRDLRRLLFHRKPLHPAAVIAFPSSPSSSLIPSILSPHRSSRCLAG